MRFSINSVIFTLLVFSFSATGLQAQITQAIRGTVTDKHTGVPLIGATVVLLDHDPLLGTITDHQGYFSLTGVPVGRRGIRVHYMGYNAVVRKNLEISSGKAFTITIELEEAVIMGEEAVVRARSGKGQALNEMALVSARSFNMEEAERYAGSWGDPARLVANFAGVQSPADQSNDIIIRGNSPAGLLWKMEGVTIYNPNHFGSIGSTGGPVSMINNNMLANSDFYSGAFPAEYGNALSGVFDLNLRSGNNRERELTAQVGFNGFEFGAEGPFSKESNASYLVSYRYSSLAFFSKLGLDLGVPAIPYYQDLTFKIDIPVNEKSRLTLFGLGGANHIGMEEVEGGDYFAFKSYAETGALGISHKHYFNSKTRLRTILSWGAIRNRGIDSSGTDGVLGSLYGQRFAEQKYTLQTDLRRKLSRRDHLVGGLEVSYIKANYKDSTYVPGYNFFFTLSNTEGSLFMLRSFINWKHKFTEEIQLVTGIQTQQVTLNNDYAIEPRVSLNWKVTGRQEISLGYGLHSQAQPRTVYFSETLIDTMNLVYKQTNKELGFTRSHQVVLGYQLLFNPKHRLKAEVYYQRLFDVPVTTSPSHISMINYGASFSSGVHDSLVSEGEGWNRGIELTMERFFADRFYYLATLSLFDSKYRASDGKIRNSVFNGNFIANLLGGYEWPLGSHDAISVDGRLSWAGGLRMVPIDLEASREVGRTIWDNSRAYESRDRDYFRIDLRIAYKWNRPKATWTFSADIQNLTNHINPFFKEYNPDTGEIEQVSQIGIIPAGVIRVNF
ncbi:MAG: TonB-dependent receptor [Bacteroidota bacterium]